jgi:hypothetical protein
MPTETEPTQWWKWVDQHLNVRCWTNADLARAARQYGTSVDESVIGRWKNRGATPELQSVRAVARAFERDIREAAIAAGLLTAEEIHSPWPALDLAWFSDEQLIAEVQRRMMRPQKRRGRRPR